MKLSIIILSVMGLVAAADEIKIEVDEKMLKKIAKTFEDIPQDMSDWVEEHKEDYMEDVQPMVE